MSSSHKRYSRKFKLEVIRRLQETGRIQAQTAKELGVTPNTLSHWMRQHRDEKTEAFPGTGKLLRLHKRGRYRVIAARVGQYPIDLMCLVAARTVVRGSTRNCIDAASPAAGSTSPA